LAFDVITVGVVAVNVEFLVLILLILSPIHIIFLKPFKLLVDFLAIFVEFFLNFVHLGVPLVIIVAAFF